MKFSRAELAAAGIIVLSLIIGIVLYPQMPDQMASHWNAGGQVDGYTGKFWGLFLMPLISIAMLALFIVIPRIDPLKENIAAFRKHFDTFVVLLIVFLFYVYMLMLAWNFGFMVDMMRALSPAFAVLFYFTGMLMEKSKRNWFVGVRTPWTMSSDIVWKETNEMGGRMMRTAAIIALIGVALPQYAMILVIAPALAFAISTFVYSYFVFKRGSRGKDRKRRKR